MPNESRVPHTVEEVVAQNVLILQRGYLLLAKRYRMLLDSGC